MAKPNGDKLNDSRKAAFRKLNIDPGQRIILSLDGGGMRGILTIQLLAKLEEVAGIPCYELADMVSGTSTGAIIAALIVTKHTAAEIGNLYESLVNKAFHKNDMGSRFYNPPQFSKDVFRASLKEVVGDLTLAQACALTDTDLMVTSRDMTGSEETFFSCFKQKSGEWYGTYCNILLRGAVESSMSAPTYFHPLERFVDGGTTTYNNPSMAAFMEAVSYSSPDKAECAANYPIAKITIFSFGTGVTRQFVKPEKTGNPKGLDLVFWLTWLMNQTGQDASAMQIDIFRSPIIRQVVDLRRFQISLDQKSIGLLPNSNNVDQSLYKSAWLHDLSDEILGHIDMADTTHFALMKVIGQQMAEYIMQSGYQFTQDLVDQRGSDLLVTHFGDIVRIRTQMSSPEWLDTFSP